MGLLHLGCARGAATMLASLCCVSGGVGANTRVHFHPPRSSAAPRSALRVREWHRKLFRLVPGARLSRRTCKPTGVGLLAGDYLPHEHVPMHLQSTDRHRSLLSSTHVIEVTRSLSCRHRCEQCSGPAPQPCLREQMFFFITTVGLDKH